MSELLLKHFDLMAQAPDGVARLRELILTLAVQGKLVPQDPNDEPASALLQHVREEKDRLIAEGKIKRDKPLLPITEDEKPFELPTTWEWVRLAALASFENGDRGSNYPSRSSFVEQGVPFINAGHLVDERINYSDMNYISQQNFALLRSGKIKRDDILYCLRGSLGKFAQVQSDEPGAIASSLVIIRLVCTALSSFAMWYLKSPLASSLITRFDNGTAQPNLGAGDLAKFIVPLPPSSEQSRIVTRIEELMHLCDALEAKQQLHTTQHAQLVQTLLSTLTDSTTPEELATAWQRVATHFDLLLDRPEAVDALEQTILQLAVRGLLVPQDPNDEPASVLLQRIRAEKDRLIAEGKIKRDKPLPPITDEEKPFELPQGWEWVRFGDYFFELCTGPFGSVIHKEDYVTDGVPLINPSHMINGRISHDPAVSIPVSMADQMRAYRLSAGDVVLARRGEVGRYALVTEAEDGWLCGTGSFFVKLHELCNRKFLGLILEDPRLRKHLLGESVGSTMVNLNQRILLETPIAIPSTAEQARVVKRVEELQGMSSNLRRHLASGRITQAHLAEALLENLAA